MTTLAAAAHTIQGTEGYFSPELQKDWIEHKRMNGPRTTRHQPNKSDVYSLGLTVLQALTLESVMGLNTIEKQAELSQKLQSLPISADFREVLQAMLEFDSHKRSSFKDICALMSTDRTL